MPNAFVVAMGIGTVFFGLICIIILSCIMSAICVRLGKKGKEAPVAATAAPAVPAAPVNTIPNRQALIAAVSAAIAEDMGTDPAGIRILSVKKI